MGRVAFVLFFLFWLGCASQPVVLLNSVTDTGENICLDDRANIPAFVQKFYATRDLTTEEGKIDYLIERVKNANLVFVRNKVEYTSPAAAGFLRWKLERMEKKHNVKIQTAQDFVSQVVSGSRMSGEPYTVILKGGGSHNFQDILQNELDLLNQCLEQYASSSEQSVSR